MSLYRGQGFMVVVIINVAVSISLVLDVIMSLIARLYLATFSVSVSTIFSFFHGMSVFSRNAYSMHTKIKFSVGCVFEKSAQEKLTFSSFSFAFK